MSRLTTHTANPKSSILKNKLGIRDQARLEAFEAEISFQRSTEPLPAGTLGYKHYCAIHSAIWRNEESQEPRAECVGP